MFKLKQAKPNERNMEPGTMGKFDVNRAAVTPEISYVGISYNLFDNPGSIRYILEARQEGPYL